MAEDREIARQRKAAVRILRQSADQIMHRWLLRIQRLTSERDPGTFAPEEVVRADAAEFFEMLLSRLEGRSPEADLAAFYHLILDGRQYQVRLADIAYMLLELKSICNHVIHLSEGEELEAFRIGRIVDETIEGVLRKSADLYELTTEADQRTAQVRLQELFTAWELEEALGSPQTSAGVVSLAADQLEHLWELSGCRVRLYDTPTDTPVDLVEGPPLPVPVVTERHQYLTGEELEAGGGICLMEDTRRRRAPFICEEVRDEGRIVNAAELLEAGVRSLACCPLISREQVRGVLLLCSDKASAFHEAEERRLQDIAVVLALALDRTGRLEVSHREMSEAEVIGRIGRTVLELPGREELLQGVAEALREFRDYLDVSIFRVDEQADQCVLVAEAGRERRYRPAGYRQEIGKGFIGLCAQTGETIRSVQPDMDPRRLVAFEEEHRARTELAVPVRSGETVLGVMHFLSETADDFPQSEIAALEHAAPHIGVALQNARMLQERRRDRYRIEQAHRQLANIIRSTAVGITSCDPRGVYTHWSPSCESMTGYSADEMLGQKTPADMAAEPYDLEAALARCLREGQTSFERTIRRKDGAVRIVRETRVPLPDEDGNHVGFTAYLVDVTEQKRAADEVRRERDTLSSVVAAMGAGLAILDGRQQLQWANRSLREWFAFTPASFGRPCHEVGLCGRADERGCPVRAALATGRPQTSERELTDARGIWHCYQQVFTPLGHGDLTVVALTMDITEQRRQTEQMRLINKLTEKVETTLDLERVLHLVLTCVTAGHAIGLNRAFVFLLDDEGSALEGRMAVGPVSREDAERIWAGLKETEQTIDELLAAVSPSEGDLKLTEAVRTLRIPLWMRDCPLISTLDSRTAAHLGDARSDPHMLPDLVERLALDEFVCVPLAVQDEPLGVMVADNKYSGSPIDHTQVELLEMFSRQASLAIANARAYERIRDQLQELRRTRDRLIEAERMASVGRMASHLAHEIRNPLTAIGGFARSIARQQEEGSAARRSAEVIYQEVRRLEQTLANVLDYTRPLRPNKQPVLINDLVRETLEQFEPQLREDEIRTRLDLDESLPRVKADPGMVKQVIINLIKNAAESMEGKGGGTLSVQTRRDGERVAITVGDTGSGIDPDTVQELFSPFFTTRIGGIGLGLSISRRIVRQHGGHIEVETQLGAGSHFTATLAVDAAAEAARAGATETQKGGTANAEDPAG